MRAVVQRVLKAQVTVEQEVVGAINSGFMVLLGVEQGDTEKDAVYIATKLVGLRVFEDAEDKMNLSLQEVGGDILLVSQFTLLGDCRKGRRPAFVQAARPEEAASLYEKVTSEIERQGIKVATGRFQTHMEVSLVNDGPVTLLLDSKKVF